MHIRHRGSAIQSADFAAALRRLGIAARRHHHGDRGDVAPAQVEVGQLAVIGRLQRREQVGHQPRHQRLAFRIAEADVELDQLDAFGGQHQPGVQDAAERRAAVAPSRRAPGRMMRVHRGILQRRRERRRRRVGAHAAGVRSGLALADALVVLRGAERQRGRAVAQREQRDLLADAGIPRSPPRRRRRRTTRASIIASMAASASSSVAATTTPLPAARPSAFTTSGAPRRRTNSRAASASSKRSHCAVGMPAASHSSLVKALLPSSCAAGARRADAGDRCGFHRVGDAGDQRRLGAGNDEVDLVVLRERDQCGEIQHADRHAFGDLGDAGIAWRAPEFRQQRAGGDRPAQRVLASTRSDHQNAHARLLPIWRHTDAGCSIGFLPLRSDAPIR